MRTCGCARQGRRAAAQAGRGEPAPRGPAPGARARPVHLRPVRRHRRPRPPQGRPGALPAVADEPAAARVRAPRRRPGATTTTTTLPGTRSRQALEKHSRVQPIDEAAWQTFAERIAYQRGDFADPAGFDALAEAARRARQGARHPRQPALLPRDPAVGVRGDRRAARAVGLDHEHHGGGWRRIVIEKPFGHDLESAQPAEPRGRQGLPRGAGLPHRPLPREGDRPEPAGLPLRERDLRADLEPPPHRPRADHRRRVDRRRGPRRVLRGDGRARATSSRTTSSSCCRLVAMEPPDDVRGGRPARREGQGHPGDRGHVAPSRSSATSSAASTDRAGSPASPCRATARSRRSTRSRRPRRSSRPG